MFKILFHRFIKDKYPNEKTKEDIILLKNFNKSIKSNPNNPNTYFNRANFKFKLGNYKGAMKDYNIAIKLNPKYLEAYHSRAIVKERLDYYNGAIADYNIILKIDPSNLLASKNKKIIQQKFYHKLKNMNI